MEEFFLEYGIFLAKILTLVAIAVLLLGLAAASSRSRTHAPEKLEIKHLNDHYERMAWMLKMHIVPKKEFAKEFKARKNQKKRQKKSGTRTEKRKRIFVLDFHGDIRATAVGSLREEITAILSVATPEDEVLLRLENAGGMVHDHGLAASQLVRLREKQIPLTVAVDKMAASGGYMMACVGNHVIAAPFAVIGSIGALVQLPNFHRLLDKYGVDFEQIKAGELKRTLTLFGMNTDSDRERAKEQVEDVHHLFKEFIAHYRPAIDLSQVATGQHWHGLQAQELGLVDALKTSDDYLLEASNTAAIYAIEYSVKKAFSKRLLARVQSAADKALSTLCSN